MKTCTSCNTTKTLESFWRDKRKPNGRMAVCKVCKTAKLSKYRKERGYDKIRYWKNPVAERERHLIRKYGVTLSDYDLMLNKQGGKCAICKRTQSKSFDVDHCHTTGLVRGLLCTNCNRMVGHAGDDPQKLESAAAYLRQSYPK